MFRPRRKKRLFWFSLVFSLILLLAGGSFLIVFALTRVPSVNNLSEREVPESTKIYDHTGKILLWEIHGEERRTSVPFEKISKDAKNAAIAIEDSSFYTHGGIRPLSLVRALFVDLLHGDIEQGGSTITQQLVKRTFLTPEKTITRKLKEIIIALKLETVYSKDEILNLYLNEIPYGSGAYGIEAASETYFGKSSEELSLAEAAYLAALPQAPSYYSPYGNHRDELENRKNLVLKRMRELGFISEDDYTKASTGKVSFVPQKKFGIFAPHFVMYVRELLNEKYGESVVERGGLKVITTLDVDLQQKAEAVMAKRGPEISQKFRASNAGFVALDPKTGRILMMVGSRDYFDTEHEGNFNVVLAHRQPGSAFKPIVYATAFKKGYTPETALFDLETNFAVSGPPYIPQNYDSKFRGPVTMREALAQSLNVPSVETLYLAGVKDSIETAQSLGITSLADPGRYGLTLVLGGGEVSLLELSSAYGVFATGGMRADTHPIIEVRGRDDKVLDSEDTAPRRVLEENIANLINSILTDNNARAPAFGAASPLYFESGNVAVKTGTTNDYRDVWTIGYSPTIAVGAWAGNNDSSSMTKNVAGFIIAPVWRELMNAALATVPNESLSTPAPSIAKKPVLRGIWQGSRSYVVDKTTGQLATDSTPPEDREERVNQEIHSILYWVNKDDPDGPIPDHPERDSQFENWERPVEEWAARMNLGSQTIQKPQYDSTHSPQNWPHIELDPSRNLSFRATDQIIFYPRISGTYPVSTVNIFVDGGFVRSATGVPESIEINKLDLGLNRGDHTLTLKVYDSIGNKQEKNFTFSLLDH